MLIRMTCFYSCIWLIRALSVCARSKIKQLLTIRRWQSTIPSMMWICIVSGGRPVALSIKNPWMDRSTMHRYPCRRARDSDQIDRIAPCTWQRLARSPATHTRITDRRRPAHGGGLEAIDCSRACGRAIPSARGLAFFSRLTRKKLTYFKRRKDCATLYYYFKKRTIWKNLTVSKGSIWKNLTVVINYIPTWKDCTTLYIIISKRSNMKKSDSCD
jgi:hypothetical protein